MDAEYRSWIAVTSELFDERGHTKCSSKISMSASIDPGKYNAFKSRSLDKPGGHKRVRPGGVTERAQTAKFRACTESGVLTNPNGEN